MTLQLRRGNTASRTAVTPDIGEPGWDTQTNQLYIGREAGDGETGNQWHLVGGGTPAPTVPAFTVVTAGNTPAGTVMYQVGLVLTGSGTANPPNPALPMAPVVVNGAVATTSNSLVVDGGNLPTDFVESVNNPYTDIYVGKANTGANALDATDNSTYRRVVRRPSTAITATSTTIPLQASGASGQGNLAFDDNDTLFFIAQTINLTRGAHYWDGSFWLPTNPSLI